MIICFCESICIQPEYSDLPLCICKGLCSTKPLRQPFAYAAGIARSVSKKPYGCSERIWLHGEKWLP